MRAIAATAVVLTHLPHVANDVIGDRTLGIPDLLSFGYAGVDLFFVVSGFIIAHITASTAFELRAFLSRRFVRIVPLYWLYTLVFVAMAVASGHDEPLLASLPESLAMVPQRDFPTLPVGWSLEHELVFYVIAAGTLMCGGSLLHALVVASLGAIALHVIARGADEAIWDFHLLSLYHVEFSVGVLVHRCRRALSPRAAHAMLLVGVALFVATSDIVLHERLPGVATQTVNEGWLGLVRVLGFGAGGGAIVLGLLRIEMHGRLARWPRATAFGCRVGDASYSIYLSHLLVFKVLGKAYAAVGVPASLVWPALGFAVVVALLVGFASYAWVERPLLAAMTARRASVDTAGSQR